MDILELLLYYFHPKPGVETQWGAALSPQSDASALSHTSCSKYLDKHLPGAVQVGAPYGINPGAGMGISTCPSAPTCVQPCACKSSTSLARKGWFAHLGLSQQHWHSLESRLLARFGDGAAHHDSLAGVEGTGVARCKKSAFPYDNEPREVGGTLLPPVHPLILTTPPGCCGASGGVPCSAPTSCLRRQAGLAGAVPDTHPLCWRGVNRSGSRQGSRERAGLGLCPTARGRAGIWGAPRQGMVWREGDNVVEGSLREAGYDLGLMGAGVLPLPQFTPSAKVGLFRRDSEVVVLPQTTFSVPAWEAHGLGLLRSNPPPPLIHRSCILVCLTLL